MLRLGPSFIRLVLILLLGTVLIWSCSDDEGEPILPDGDSDVDIETDGGASDGDEESDLPEGDEEADNDGEADLDGDGADDPDIPLIPAACLCDPTCTFPLVTAHRGHHVGHPENSLAAIRSAAAIGAAFAEVDVRHSSDGALVLMHDDTVDRTTDGSGEVAALTLAELQALTLNGADPGDAESVKIPTFSDALALAAETGLMLYVDQKTDREDWVAAAIAAGPYYEQALVRDGAGQLQLMLDLDSNLLVMPPVNSVAEAEAAQQLLPGLCIVEIAKAGPEPDLTAGINGLGLKVQQDVMAAGDSLAFVGDYSGWAAFVEAGVFLLQSDMPAELVVALDAYHENGVFPTGP